MFDGMNKKAAVAAENGEDRISDLPDALLHHALSLLPVHQAVQTSVLAHRWRHLWKGMPALRLVDPKTRFATVQDIDRFVNRLIANRGHLPLVSFEVEAHAYLTWDDYDGDFEEPKPILYFDSWIQYALACKVQVLKVVGKLGCGLEFSVPLISQHLRILDLHDVYIESHMEHDSMDFSSCPVLEELKMEGGGIWVRSISFPSLKRLLLIKCIFPGDQRVSISAPGIVSLRLVQCACKTPLLENMPVLETASIDLSRRAGFMDKCEDCTDGDGSCEGCHGYPVGSYRSVLLNVLSNAINLELKDQPEAYIYKRDLECCPIFGRLKTLLLDMWCRHVDMHALVRFLQHTPILEKLTLQLRSDKNRLCAGRGERKHVRIEQSFSCAHLKEVSIECEEKLRVKDKVRQIVKILTRNGILKEQITFKKLPKPKVYRVMAVSPTSSDDSW